MVKEYLIPTLRSTDLIPIGNRDRSLTRIKNQISRRKLAPMINKNQCGEKEIFTLRALMEIILGKHWEFYN